MENIHLDPAKRIATRLPLDELWNEQGTIEASKGRDLSREAIRDLLRLGPVQFIVADLGSPLRWFPEGACYDFWKTEVQGHLADPDSEFMLEDFPGEYCYLASEWTLAAGDIVVVLEMAH